MKYLPLLLLLTACQQPQQQAEPLASGPPADSQLAPAPSADSTLMATDRAEYHLRETPHGLEAQILYTYTNRTGGTVYLSNCNGNVSPGLQRLEGGAWEDAWSPTMNECLSLPVTIPQGGTYTDSLGLHVSPEHGSLYTDIQSPERGSTYRLVWHQSYRSYNASGYPFGEQLPLEQKVSNGFLLKVE